jgi:hypothetical protein
MSKGIYGKTVLCILLVALCAGLVVVYSRFNPEESPWFPKCIFLQLTGLKCPGCGSQRAIHSLLNLDIAAAFRQNAFLILCLPYLAALAASCIFKERLPRFYNFLNSVPVIVTLAVLVILWWVLRNILGL